jgi:hypothetical protein
MFRPYEEIVSDSILGGPVAKFYEKLLPALVQESKSVLSYVNVKLS